MPSVAHIVRRRKQRRARRRKARATTNRWNFLIAFVLTLLVILPVGITLGGALLLYNQAARWLPGQEATTFLDPIIGPTELYDRNDTVLLYAVEDPLGNQRAWVKLDDLPPYVVDATLLMEDPDFLQTVQFDTGQILGKLWLYMFGETVRQDRSLTGRLVNNAIMPMVGAAGLEDTLMHMVLSAEVNRRYSAEDIVEWHLNTNYYGNDAYGIDAAARVYFGKTAAELTLDEMAMLAPITLVPRYNPYDNYTAAQSRQSDLLRTMLNHHAITQAEYETAAARTTQVRPDLAQTPEIAPEFAVYAREQTEDILDSLGLEGARLVSRGGLRVTTTLDLDLYYQSECVLRTHLARLNNQPLGNVTLTGQPCTGTNFLPTLVSAPDGIVPDMGSLVVQDVATGEIKSMVGHATDVAYQPGPTLHPFVYFDGFLSLLFNPATMVLDIPQSFPGPAEGLIYPPNNPDGKFRGPINLRDAMAAGLLPPAVSVADNQGLRNILVKAHRLGLNSLDENIYDLSLLERGGEVSVLDMTYAYSVFSRMGVMQGIDVGNHATGYRQRDPVAVLRIEDHDGNLLWEYSDNEIALSITNVFPASVGYLINDVLSDFETRQAVLGIQDDTLNLLRPAAIVNGITSDKVDSWTVGYTPQIVVGVNLRRSDSQPSSLDVYGLQGAAPVWRAIMGYVHERENLPPIDWQRPDGVVDVVICEKSGMIPSEEGCQVRTESIPSAAKLSVDTYWESHEINTQNRLLATPNTPANLRSEILFFVPPEKAMDWWVSNGQVLPPVEYDQLSRPNVLKSVEILQPINYADISGTVDIRGSIDLDSFQYYELSYGITINPNQWFPITGQQTDYAPGTSMGLWDTSSLNGLYTLRLTVVLPDNTIDNDFILVSIDNIAPTVNLTAGTPGQTFKWPDDPAIPLTADVSEDVERVEFYHNGLLIGEDNEWPYGFNFPITRTGLETFTAVAYDVVGNQGSSEIQIEVTRSGG